VPIYRRVIEITTEDLPQFYLFSISGGCFRDRVKDHEKDFSARFAWRGGGYQVFLAGQAMIKGRSLFPPACAMRKEIAMEGKPKERQEHHRSSVAD